MRKLLRKVFIFVLALTLICVGGFGNSTVYAGQVTPIPPALQNGDFEAIGSFTRNLSHANFVPQAQFPGWVTSDSLEQFELWPNNLRPTDGTFGFPAASGIWFVELNANDAPSPAGYANPVGPYIFQDVTTIPGALYQWAFFHRGRNGTGTNYDVAAMLLGDPTLSGGTLNITDHAQNTFLPGGGLGPNRLNANNAAWVQHLGYYKPATDRTRFQLFSVSSIPGTGTGAGRYAEGNLVDGATWIRVAAPTVTLVASGAPVSPDVVGQVAQASGFRGEFAAAYDFVTPGVLNNVIVNVLDSNGIQVGYVESIVLIYGTLMVRYVNQQGVEIAPPTGPIFFPANFAAKDPVDFVPGAFLYTAPAASSPITDPISSVVYILRASDPLSLATDPSGLSDPVSGDLTALGVIPLRGNATVTYVYEPQPQTLTVRFVDENGNEIQPQETTLVNNGATYRVTVVGDPSDIDFPIEIDVSSTTYSFAGFGYSIVPSVGSPPLIGNPPTGIMDGDKIVYVVYNTDIQTHTVSGTLYDQNNNPITDIIEITYTLNGVNSAVDTDGSGNFSITNVPAGSTMIIQAPGDWNGMPARPVLGYSLFNIQDDMPNNNFTYLPLVTVSGTVSGLPGTYNAGVEVNFTRVGPFGSVVSGSVFTDAAGFYEIPGVAVGSKSLYITVPSAFPATAVGLTGNGVFVPTPTEYNLIDIVDDMLNQDFEYVERFTVSGNVSGLPSGNYGIAINYKIDAGGTVTEGTVTTDAIGNYSIPNVPAGAEVNIICPIPQTDIDGLYIAGPSSGYLLTGVSDDLSGNDFIYGISYAVSGTVSGLSNNGGVEIRYTITDPWGVETTSSVFTLANGDYLIPNVRMRSRITIYVPGAGAGFTVSPATDYDLRNIQHNLEHNDFVFTSTGRTVGGNGGGDGGNEITTTAPHQYPQRQAYLIGYASAGELRPIRPQGNITRAEVATIFFRMITDQARAEYWSQGNPFDDVQLQNWFNNAISTTFNMGLWDERGFGDGLFMPNQNITRGELAVVLVRFMDYPNEPVATGIDQFNDIAGHWASGYINEAARKGWILGYPDGSFGPSEPITRAETAAMINRIFNRLPETVNDLLPDMITWPDNMNVNAWYYFYIQAATNSYTYRMKADGIHETWIQLLTPRNWALLERPESTPNSIR